MSTLGEASDGGRVIAIDAKQLPARRKRTSDKIKLDDETLRKPAIKPSVIQQCRTGYTRLVQVSDFIESYARLQDKLEEEMAYSDAMVDLSVDEVRVQTPFQAVESSILSELQKLRPGEEHLGGKGEARADSSGLSVEQLVAQAHMPVVDELEAPLLPLKKRRRREAGKRVRKEINAISEKALDVEVREMLKSRNHVPVHMPEVILRVAVFHPHTFAKTQEFLVLGSQRLTELKDAIATVGEDFELDTAQMPSGFFFIENKFYNDLRDRRAILYSDPIVQWVKQDNRFTHPSLSHFETASMHETRFDELKLRLGSHYLYQHHGDVQQTMIFTDMRMMHGGDYQDRQAYPLKVFQHKSRRRKCRVCDLFPAKYVTYGDRLAHENPFFWCEQCYKIYHYNYEGMILYSDFQVYKYRQD